MLPRVGLFGLAQLLALAAGLALQSLVARRLGAGDYGRFVTVQSVLLVALVFLMSAVPSALRRRVSFDPGSLEAAWRMLWLVQVPLCLACAALLSCLSSPAAEILNYPAVTVNLWVAKATISDQELLGAYAACYTLAHVVLLFGVVLCRSFFSCFAQMIAGGDKSKAADLLRQPLRLVALLAGLGAAVAVGHGEALVGMIYGRAFAAPGKLVTVLGMGMAGMAPVWFLAEMLAAAGRLRARLGVGICTFAVSLSAALLLTQRFGIWGAAWGLFACMRPRSCLPMSAPRRYTTG